MSKRTFTEKHVPEGVTARWHHCRDENNIIVTTVCQLIDDVTKAILCVGYAHVSPRDMANKKIGRAISVGRALKLYFRGN